MHTGNPEEKNLLGELTADFQAMNKEVTLQIRQLELFQLVSQLQLALSHPANIDPTAEYAAKFIDDLAETVFADMPAVQKVIAMNREKYAARRKTTLVLSKENTTATTPLKLIKPNEKG